MRGVRVLGLQHAIVARADSSGAPRVVYGAWTPEELSAFLTSPKGYAPGTTMGFAGLRKVEDRADVIAYLQSVSN